MRCSLQPILMVLACASPTAASAQYIGGHPPPPPVAPLPGQAESPEAALARNVRLLAISPRGYDALLGAGRAALRLGDAQAAIGFFGRAEEVNPVSWVPKWGEGAALVAMEEPQSALGYFAEAQRLGASLVNIAADRGLAFDLLGNQPGAQADYRIALNGVDAVEARRRLALSLAVMGNKAEALATLDPLLVRRDPGALRARAFVLALSGDADAARNAVNAAMPGMASVLDPFFRRLPGLQPAEKVAAVHFGHFPTGVSVGGAVQLATRTAVPPPPAARVEPPRWADPTGIRPGEPLVPSTGSAATYAPMVSVPVPSYAVPVPRAQSVVTGPPISVSTAPVRVAPVPPVRDLADNSPLDRAAMVRRPRLFETPPPAATAPVAVTLVPAPANPSSTPIADGLRLAELDGVLAAMPEPTANAGAGTRSAAETRRAEARTKAAADLKAKAGLKAKADAKSKVADALAAKAEEKAEAKLKADAKAAAKLSPGRYWVQLAGGANAERMRAEYKHITAKKPALFARRSPYVAALKGWSRLLVGPFASEDEAQVAVNAIRGVGIEAFAWASPSGQKVERLPSP